MPLKTFQSEVLAFIRANRSPESHLAGGIVLNHAPDSPQYSKDLDIFHEDAEALARICGVE